LQSLTIPLLCLLLAAPWKAELPLDPPKNGGVYVVAHRGVHKIGDQRIPENTLAAYQKAIDLGCDFVEIDCRTTKDGKLVSVHNREIDAYVVDGSKGAVRDLTLEAIQKLDIGSRIGPEFKGAQVPTLDEILDLCKGKIGIYFDHKDAAVAPVVAEIKERGMEHAVLWYSTPSQIAELRELCPECVEMPEGGNTKSLAGVIETARPRVIAAVWREFSREFVESCHKAGAKVIVDEGGENKKECWKKCLEWGVDGIQTDDPAALIAFLKEQTTRK
jgi:glycerophosphoryl diester phosphodiesterase